MDKKYVFIKAYTNAEGTIPVGSEICLFHGMVYFNGGMCMPSYASMLRNIVENKALHDEYLKDVVITKNEF